MLGLSYITEPLCLLLVGLIVPYGSFKAIRSVDADDDKRCLMFWIIYSLFTTAEKFGVKLFLSWIPIYYEARFVFLLWLRCPCEGMA